MSIQVQQGREMQENYLEDEAVLTSYMHDMRAAREDADKELAHMRKMAEEAHKDWQRKLKDRRKEVCWFSLHRLIVHHLSHTRTATWTQGSLQKHVPVFCHLITLTAYVFFVKPSWSGSAM